PIVPERQVDNVGVNAPAAGAEAHAVLAESLHASLGVRYQREALLLTLGVKTTLRMNQNRRPFDGLPRHGIRYDVLDFEVRATDPMNPLHCREQHQTQKNDDSCDNQALAQRSRSGAHGSSPSPKEWLCRAGRASLNTVPLGTCPAPPS